MTDKTTETIRVDQFVQASPERVWRTLSEPALLAKWWAAGDISDTVGHEFTLDMPGFGLQPCKVIRAERYSVFEYTFTTAWTLTWTLIPEGKGTRLILEHSGFDLDDPRMAAALERMGPGWRDVILPKLADAAQAL